MVRIRLKRIGRSQQPFFRVVVADSRLAVCKKYIDLLGTYCPLKHDLKIDQERTLTWLKKGAQPTDSVRTLLSKAGVLKAYHEFCHSPSPEQT